MSNYKKKKAKDSRNYTFFILSCKINNRNNLGYQNL